MAVIPSLEIGCCGADSVGELLLRMRRCGWTWQNAAGEVEHIPLYDKDDFNWTGKPMTDAEVLSWASQKIAEGEPVMLELYAEGTEIGVMFFASSPHELCFSLNCNRVRLCDVSDVGVTDVSWYMRNLVMKLKDTGLTITSLRYDEF